MTELSPHDRAFLELAMRARGPTAADRARVRRAIAVAAPLAGLGVMGAGAKAAGASLGLVKTVVIFAVAVGVGAGAVMGGAAVTRSKTTPPQRVVAPVVAAREALVAAEVPVAPPVPEPEPVRARGPARARAPVPHAEVPTPAIVPTPAPAPQPSPCSVEVEASALQRAQRLLASSPDQSLDALDTLERSCPDGELVEERHAARALALCALGRRDEGRTHVEWLRRNRPSSPALPRASKACGDEG